MWGLGALGLVFTDSRDYQLALDIATPPVIFGIGHRE